MEQPPQSRIGSRIIEPPKMNHREKAAERMNLLRREKWIEEIVQIPDTTTRAIIATRAAATLKPMPRRRRITHAA